MSALIGENAVFYCNGSGAIIQWIVDGVYATHSNITARGIVIHIETLSGNTLQSTLTVPATLENNGTTVQCIVFPSEVTSDIATLTVLPGEQYRDDKIFTHITFLLCAATSHNVMFTMVAK